MKKTNNLDHWFTNPEYVELVESLKEKSMNTDSPLNIYQLCREFQEETGATQSVCCLTRRISKFRSKILFEARKFDMETKVKFLFALSIPIEKDLLLELKKSAYVTLDDYWRIMEYRKKGGGLELIGEHPHPALLEKTTEKDNKLLEFLAEQAKNRTTIISCVFLAKDFKEAMAIPDTTDNLELRFGLIKKRIYEMEGVDEETKIRMMFCSNAEVPNYVLKEIRKNAHVEVDALNRITKYSSGSLNLEGDHSLQAKMAAGREEAKRRHLVLNPPPPDSSDEEKSEVEEEEVDFDYDVYRIENKRDVVTRSGRVSKKRISNFQRNVEELDEGIQEIMEPKKIKIEEEILEIREFYPTKRIDDH